MATSSVLDCVSESWEILNFYKFWSPYNNWPMIQIVRDRESASNPVHYFTIRNDATTVNLKAILSLDRSPSSSKSSFVLSIVRNGYHSNTRVYVRLHDIKIFVDSREVIAENQGPGFSGRLFNARPDSGEVELGRRDECRVNTNITLSDIRRSGHSGVVRIEFTLCNKILTSLPVPAEVAKDISGNIQGDLQQFGFQTLNDFESMLNDTTTTDVAIKVTLGAEKIFQCHKFILTARSPVFRAMFASQMTEAADNLVVIQDMSAPTMGHFLSFLYCGHFQDDTWIKCLPNLTYVGHKYEVASLKQLCNLHLIKSVTNQNAVAVANLAQCYELTTALAQIKQFIHKNSAEVNFDFAKAADGLEIGQQ